MNGLKRQMMLIVHQGQGKMNRIHPPLAQKITKIRINGIAMGDFFQNGQNALLHFIGSGAGIGQTQNALGIRPMTQ
jgi:hypothetical protein